MCRELHASIIGRYMQRGLEVVIARWTCPDPQESVGSGQVEQEQRWLCACLHSATCKSDDEGCRCYISLGFVSKLLSTSVSYGRDMEPLHPGYY